MPAMGVSLQAKLSACNLLSAKESSLTKKRSKPKLGLTALRDFACLCPRPQNSGCRQTASFFVQMSLRLTRNKLFRKVLLQAVPNPSRALAASAADRYP